MVEECGLAGVGVDDQPVIKRFAGDLPDDIENCRLFVGQSSGVKIDVSGGASRVVRSHQNPAFEREQPGVLGGGEATQEAF